MNDKGILAIIASILFSSILFSSCSDSDENIDEVIPFKLVLSKSVVQPFDSIEVTIGMSQDQLVAIYDSIVWQGNGVPRSIRWYWGRMEKTVTFSDYRIEGKYKIYALGYKQGVLISKDSVEYEMTKPHKEFIAIDWATNQKSHSLNYTTGYSPFNLILDESVNRNTTKGIGLTLDYVAEDNSNKSEYATMSFSYWTYSTTRAKTSKSAIPSINEFEWFSVENTDEASVNYRKIHKQESDFFYAYLTALYGEPKFNVEDDDIQEEYTKRFSFERKHYYPVQIWDTPKSYISILKCGDVEDGIRYEGYPIVIAQPRK